MMAMMAAPAVVLLLMAVTSSHAETTPLDMAETSDWAFVGPKWSQKAGPAADAAAGDETGASGGSVTGWITAPGSPRAREGNVAVYTKAAFAAPCNITLSFVQGQSWTTAALVVGARNLSDGYFFIDVPIEGQEFRTENTFVSISRANAASWREGLTATNGVPFIGPVPGVSSSPNLEHTLRAELTTDAVGKDWTPSNGVYITLWLDRQPLGTFQLPGMSMPAHIGLASYSMLGAGPIAQFKNVQVEGATAPPEFDATAPLPRRSWEVSKSNDKTVLTTTSIGNAVVLPHDGSVVAMNNGMLVRTTDKAATWSKLSELPLIQGGHLLYNAKDSSLSVIGVAKPPAGVKKATGPATMLRAVSSDGGKTFGAPETVGVINTTLWGPQAGNVSLGGFDNILHLSSKPGTVLLCGGGFSPQTMLSTECPADLSGKPPPSGCVTTYLGVSERAGVPAIGLNFCMRSTDTGASWAGPVSITNGYAGIVGTTQGMLDKDVCEVTTVETAGSDSRRRDCHFTDIF